MTARNADALADQAAQLVGTNPQRAHRVSVEAAAAARTAGDSVAEARAWRVNGRAAFELGRPDEALGTLRSAVRQAEDAGAAVVAAEARMSLAYVLAEKGRTSDALTEIDKAAPQLKGESAARLLMQRGIVLWRAGRSDEALAVYRRALPTLRRGPDRLAEARLYNNRGLVYVDRGEYAAAEADLRRTAALYEENGQE